MSIATNRDYYEILGVPENASQEQIRKEYLALAKKYHPDKTGGDKAKEEKLKEINNAYTTLKNPEKRGKYDQMRANPFASSGESGGFGAEHGFGFEGDPSDILSSIFGGRHARAQQGPRRGQDVQIEVVVPLRDVVKGTTRAIDVPTRNSCEECGGTGVAPGSTQESCPECRGAGTLSQSTSGYLLRQTCPTCGGSGRIIPNPCSSCRGTGITAGNLRISVQIPAGADTGLRLRLAGQGHAGDPGAPRGDLFAVVRVLEDTLFRRSGDNVMTELPVSFTDLALGAAIKVKTLTGKAEVRLAPGTQSGEVLRLRGQGLPSLKGQGKGDLLVTVAGEAPTQLAREQIELLERFRESETGGTYPKRDSYQTNVTGQHP